MQSVMQKNEPPIRFLAEVKSDMTFAEFLAEMDTAYLRETRIYFSSGAISENIGLARTTHIIYLERVTSATSTVLAFPLTNSKNFYKLNKSSSTWGSWITIDNDSIETAISTLQNQVNDHLGYGTYFVSGRQTALDLIFDNTVTTTSGILVRLTYCNGMITMYGTLQVNSEINPGVNVLTQLTNDFLPGTGGIVQYFAGYRQEMGIGYMEGARISANIQSSIPINTNIEFRATFPCSKGFSYIDNLLADYKIPY